jgi:hypothetical protein
MLDRSLAMPEDEILCPQCGARIPISATLTTQIRTALAREFAEQRDDELERVRQDAATQAAAAQKLTARLESQKQTMEREVAKRLESVRAQAQAEAAEKAGEELEQARRQVAAQAAVAQKLTADLELQKRSMEGEFSKRLELARQRAESEAAEKARLDVERLTREAAVQKAAAQKLTGELESQRRSMAEELAQRLEDGRKQADAEAAARSRLELERVRREAAAQMAAAKKLTAQLETQKHDMEADLKRQLQAQRKTLESEIGQKIGDAHRSRELTTLRQLSDARGQIDDLKRKLEASSRQLEGEAVEADLHGLLSKAYPNDEIRALSKRGGGADVHQRIYSKSGKEVGSIIWECKNTALWSNSWVVKLRQDQRRVKADVAVLVSAARPRNCGRLEFRDGVWITEHPLAVGVAAVFRSSLLQLSQYKDLPPETAEKFAVIQRYLGSTEFRHRIEAILEAFQTMSSDLASEKRAAERHWAQREKQLQLVVENVSGMYGELRAVTGPTLARVRRLELPAPE